MRLQGMSTSRRVYLLSACRPLCVGFVRVGFAAEFVTKLE